MSRRSPSPEGVGDLLKQDSFGAFEDEEPMENGPDEVMDQDEDDFNVKLDEQANGDEMKDFAPSSTGNDDKDFNSQSGSRKPIPHFPSSMEKGSGPANARYFIIKCNNHSNIDQSVKYGIWATQKHNEDKFVDAYKSGASVFFFFSVNMSGHFQGYAKMIGLPFKHKQGLWGGGAAVFNSFDIEWIRRYDLAFRDLENIRNPLNEDKPIKISRDGQELPANLGQQVTRLFDSGCQSAGVEPPPKADRTHSFNVGPAVGGASFFRGGQGRGGVSGPRPPSGTPPRGSQNPGGNNSGLPMGMVMTPMGPVPAQMAMQMGMGMGGMMGGMDFNPMMGMSHPMMNMGMDMAAMQAMMGGRMPGMMGMPGNVPGGGPGGPPRSGPVPPPRPPPKSPPRENDMEQMMREALKTMRAANPGRNDRSREQDMIMRALEMSRRGGSPPRDRRRYRSRSRSPSPRRYKSHRRSRSRSRSRSGGRHRERADLSYDEYLAAYNALTKPRKEKDDSLDFGSGMSNGNPLMAQMVAMMGNSNAKRASTTSSGMSGGQNAASANGGNSGVGNMTEDEYVQLWEYSSKSRGVPFDANTVRGWYRQHKQNAMRGM